MQIRKHIKVIVIFRCSTSRSLNCNKTTTRFYAVTFNLEFSTTLTMKLPSGYSLKIKHFKIQNTSFRWVREMRNATGKLTKMFCIGNNLLFKKKKRKEKKTRKTKHPPTPHTPTPTPTHPPHTHICSIYLKIFSILSYLVRFVFLL